MKSRAVPQLYLKRTSLRSPAASQTLSWKLHVCNRRGYKNRLNPTIAPARLKTRPSSALATAKYASFSSNCSSKSSGWRAVAPGPVDAVRDAPGVHLLYAAGAARVVKFLPAPALPLDAVVKDGLSSSVTYTSHPRRWNCSTLRWNASSAYNQLPGSNKDASGTPRRPRVAPDFAGDG